MIRRNFLLLAGALISFQSHFAIDRLFADNGTAVNYPLYSIGFSAPAINNAHLLRLGDSGLSIPAAAPPAGTQIEVFLSGSQAGHPVNGVPGTYQPNYDNGYGTGYSTAYPTGLVKGKQRGQSEGTATGKSDGYSAGWDESYQPAFDTAYANNLPYGQEAGWKQGIMNGFAKGYDWAEAFAEDHVTWNHNPNDSYGSAGSVFISANGPGGWGGTLNLTQTVSVSDVSGFYFKLGYGDGNTAGLAAGDTDGYSETYPIAYAAAYPLGHEIGATQGSLYGIQNGKESGFNAGWQLGYGPGYDGGFAAGIEYYRTGDFALPNYAGVFGAPMPSQVPEPSSLALVGIAVAPMMLRRRRDS
jgi:PEP-CTERM motif-containing protein